MPTSADVIQAILFEQSVSKDAELSKICEKIATEIEEIWAKTTIPIITHKSVKRNVILLESKYKALLKSKNSKYFEKIRQRFTEDKTNELFDICTCKCINIFKCTCPREFKVPQIEKEFLIDQKSKRKMVLDKVDEELSRKFNRTQSAKHKANKAIQKNVDESKPLQTQNRKRTARVNTSTPTKRMKFTNTAIILDRYNISDRNGAAIITSIMKDMSDANNNEQNVQPLYRNKIRRTRMKVRKDISKSHVQNLLKNTNDRKSYAFFMDGKIDKTQTHVFDEQTRGIMRKF